MLLVGPCADREPPVLHAAKDPLLSPLVIEVTSPLIAFASIVIDSGFVFLIEMLSGSLLPGRIG